MLSYALRRSVAVVPLLLAVVTTVFVVIRLSPGGPAATILGDNATSEAISALNRELGLDRPLHVQYLSFLGDMVRGDLGTSLATGRSVAEELVGALPHTLALVLGTIVVGLVLGVLTGVLMAVYRNTWIDHVGRFLSLSGLSVPDFYLAILLIVVFSVQLGWFPFVGGGELTNPGDFLKRLVLPSLTLGLIMNAFVSRLVRSSMIEIMGLDYVRTAKAKGVARWRVVTKHVLRNSLLPLVAFLGMYIAILLGGTVIVEVVFSRRGWGRILVNAMRQRDYPVLQSGIIAFSFLIVVINMLTDLVYAWVDPRITYS